MDTISQGWVISGLGLSVIFISMTLFILIIVVLQIIFPPHAASKEDAGEAFLEIEQADEEGSIVAAIAAALISARASAHSELGKSLEDGRSGWWAANLMDARGASIEKNK